MEEKKLYEKSWFIILILVLFFPVGLFLMWKYTEWKKIVKIIISTIFALYVLIIFLAGITSQPTVNGVEDEAQTSEAVKSETSIESTQEEAENVDSGFLTSGQWAMYDQPYMFAVEVPSYEGDNYKSGDYKFTTSGGSKAGKVSAIYDIYVTDEEYSSSSDTIANEEIVCSAGGMNNEECEISLAEGNYVYVIPTENVSGSSGMLSIDIK